MAAMVDFTAARERHRRRMDAFRWELPERFNFARDVVGRHAEDPERPALLWRNAAGAERRLRYADVARESHRVAHVLRSAGVAPGDPVLVMLPRIPEWHLAMIGALEAGALVIPCATMLRPKDIAYRVGHSGARVLVVGAAQTAAVDAVRDQLPSVRRFFVWNDDGWLWFVGRADDVIISAGYRIGPFEVESALLEHPDVVEAAVVTAPDAERGAIVKAFVVLKPGVAGDDALVRALQEHVKRVTAPYKYPRAIAFVAALPKTVSGKIRRVELRGDAADGDG